jgi:hypothetical protein
VSLRVTDPSGVELVEARRWFGLPKWARRMPSGDLPALDTAPDEGIAIAVALITWIVMLILLLVLLPLILVFVAAVVGVLALLARVTALATWTVRAESADRTLQWHVRGLVRSGCLMHAVARALERGDEAALDRTTVPG